MLVVEYLTFFDLIFFSFVIATTIALVYVGACVCFNVVSVVSGALGCSLDFFCHIRAMYCTCVCSVVVRYALLMGGFAGSVERYPQFIFTFVESKCTDKSQ